MPSDPLVLAFDTSAAHCAAALLCGPRRLAHHREEMARGQAERLMPLVQELLARAGVAPGDLAAVGVGTGPGNFTGIRISVSAARGLALALGIPAIGVTAFDALAAGAPGPVLCAVDARRDMIYLGTPDGPIGPPCHPDDIPAALIGSGRDVIGAAADRLAARTGGRALAPAYPAAEAIGRVALSRLGQVDLPRPAPLYLRPSDAAPPSDPPPVILP